MTIITALNDGHNIWLGHNNGSTIGDTPIASKLQPWLFFGDWALGVTGISVQQHILEQNKQKLLEAGNEPLDVIEKIRDIFTSYGHWTFEDDTAARSFKIWSVLAHKIGRIWDVDALLSVTEIPNNTIWARGSGTDYALGAASALTGLPLSSEEKISRATHAAIECDLYCSGKAKVFKFQ